MRANGFKKALILTAAAFVTAVIGIGGAKLKVQAAHHTSGDVYYYDIATTETQIVNGETVDAGVIIHLFGSGLGLGTRNPGSGQYDVIQQTYKDLNGATIAHTKPSGQNVEIEDLNGCHEWVVQIVPYRTASDHDGLYLTLTPVEYTVTYQDGDGTVIQTSTVASGATTPLYSGATPTKTPSGGYTYAWDTVTPWTPAVAANVTADATYVANFTGTLTNYTITWKNDDGTTLKTDTVAAGDLPNYGGTPSKPDDENYTYTFSMWSPTVQLATANATYTAVYLQDPKPAPATGGGEDDSSSSTGDGNSSGDGTNGGANGDANGNRAPKTADTMPGIIVIALAGLLGGALLITGGRKASK